MFLSLPVPNSLPKTGMKLISHYFCPGPLYSVWFVCAAALGLLKKKTPNARRSFLQNLGYQKLFPNTAVTETGQGTPADEVMQD